MPSQKTTSESPISRASHAPARDLPPPPVSFKTPPLTAQRPGQPDATPAPAPAGSEEPHYIRDMKAYLAPLAAACPNLLSFAQEVYVLSTLLDALRDNRTRRGELLAQVAEGDVAYATLRRDLQALGFEVPEEATATAPPAAPAAHEAPAKAPAKGATPPLTTGEKVAIVVGGGTSAASANPAVPSAIIDPNLPLSKRILLALRTKPTEDWTTGDIATLVGATRTQISPTLCNLVTAGKARRVSPGYYRIA